MAMHIVMEASAQVPSSWKWQRPMRKVAVVELTDEYAASGERPKMISDRAKGVAKIVEVWDRLNVGKTDKCAYRVTLKEAQELAMRLNTGEA
jgi:hypothetical protein